MKGLEHHFGGSGAPFWSHFGGPGGFWLPNASRKASWAALGRFSEPRWLQLEGQDGSKLEPKLRYENLSKNRWIWGGKMEASWHQNGIKIRCYLENAEKQKVIIKQLEFQ